MLSRLPPASTSPPPPRRSSTTHRRSSTTDRLSRGRSRRRSRLLRFLESQRCQELRSRFVQSQHNQADSMSGDCHSLLPQSLDVIDVDAQLQHEDPESGSESELDSPPRITMFLEPVQEKELEKEPDFLTSPPGSPCSVRVNSTGSPKDSPNDEDQYFNYLVGNFVSVAADVCSSTLSDDEMDYKIKYELIGVTVCNDMLIREGCFSHVNFTAKANQPNVKEELFFAELRWDGVTPEPTCVICLKGMKIGGLCDTKYDNFYLEGLPVDKQHCYACDRRLKHPKNGELYNIGHIAMSQYY